MSDEARQKLAAEADRLRQERLEKEAAEKRAGEDAIASVARERRSFSPGRMRRSLSHLAILVIGLCFWVAAAVGYLEKDEPTEEPRTAEALMIRKSVFWSLVGAGAFFVVLHHSALLRFERWRRRLPFALEGTEVLGLGEAVKQAQLTIEFADTKADAKMVGELVKARLSENSSVAVQGGFYALIESDLDRQGSNHPLGVWLRRAVNRVLRDVHAAYPIRKVTLTALKTDEFYVPSGD